MSTTTLVSYGLTLLIPHLITKKFNWERYKLGVFTTKGKMEQMDREKMNMADMLSKFCIDCSDVEVIPDLNKKPKGGEPETVQEAGCWVRKQGRSRKSFHGRSARKTSPHSKGR
ncbi:solute carrier family 12 member 3-like [Patiria miniata]|uniref:SLC12A transporter C-terminal domain-containing protein n=1 Tax=Patiria miniata TaxID=46514 RepID=A0A914BK93_PATMI|nr:solute carrier family 12 member 3-like [Patiria miniata]XP_038076336.1 solute carrier family 12 member 3-like [Patiria miniata]